MFSDFDSAWGLAAEYVRLVIYGRPGTGKTTLWNTFPGPIVSMVCSGGNMPGEVKSIDTPANRARVASPILRKSDDIPVILERAQGIAGTVVLDHITGLEDLVLAELLGWSELPAQKTFGMATRDHYRDRSAKCKEMLRKILGFPGHVVVVAQEGTFGGEEGGGGIDSIAPAVGPKVGQSLAVSITHSCDYIAQTFIRPRFEQVETTVGKGPTAKTVSQWQRVRGVDYCLRVEPHDVFVTKFRVPGGVRQDVVVDPTFEKIQGLIRGETV